MKKYKNKVLLISKSGYSKDKDHILLDLIANRIKLFSVTGKDCELWHDIMDELCVGDGSKPVFTLTTWHTEGTLKEVKDFVKTIEIKNDNGISIIKV